MDRERREREERERREFQARQLERERRERQEQLQKQQRQMSVDAAVEQHFQMSMELAKKVRVAVVENRLSLYLKLAVMEHEPSLILSCTHYPYLISRNSANYCALQCRGIRSC